MSSFLNGLSVFTLLLLLPSIVFAQQDGVDLQEKGFLFDLWDATNGTYWNNNTNWLSGNTACSWFGVVCDNNSSHIIRLELESNGLEGTIPSSIGKLSYLQYLDLSDNELCGSIPSSVGELAVLEQLWLNLNYFTGIIPSSFTQLSHLNRLVLYENQLIGDISFLPSLTSLTNVDFFNNNLTGSIPQDIGLLTNLKKLWLNDNYFIGTIPASIANLTNLRFLDMSQNDLSGLIPPQIGLLSMLEALNLTDNKLNGSLPKQFGNIMRLTELFLFNNHLRGGCFPLNYSVEYCNIGDWKFSCLCPRPSTCLSGTCSLQVDLNPYTRWLVLPYTSLDVTEPLSTLKNATLSLEGTALQFMNSLLLNRTTLYMGGAETQSTFASTIAVKNKLTMQDSVVYNVDPSRNVIQVNGCVSLHNVTFYFPWQSIFRPFLSAGCLELNNVEAKLYEPPPSMTNETMKNTKGICYDTVLSTVQNNTLGVVMVEKSCLAQEVASLIPSWSDSAKVGLGVAMGVVGTLLVVGAVWFFVRSWIRSNEEVQKLT